MILNRGKSTAEFVTNPADGSRLYLVHNDALERLLFDRNLLGTDFRAACLDSSRHFMEHLADEYAPDDASELVILSKGLMYQLATASQLATDRNLATNLIATSRVFVSPDTAKIEISYDQIETRTDTLIIGDTVASGATMIAALSRYLELYPLRRVHIVSYAGTLSGATRVAEFCSHNDIESTFTYGLAAFALADNGFDLSFLHPDTLARAEYAERARRIFAGRPVSAIGWDFGSQAMAPDKYRKLCWIEAEIWGLQGTAAFAVAKRPDDWSELAHERGAYAEALERIGFAIRS